MRILNILPYSPCPPHFGGALRIYHLLKEMARSHEVTVVMYGTREEESLVNDAFRGELQAIHAVENPLKGSGINKRLAQLRSLVHGKSAMTESFYSDDMQKEIDRVVSERRFDLIQLENHPSGLFRIDSPGVPRILDTQNVEHENVRRMARETYSPVRRAFYTREYRKLHREEKEAYERQDAILVTSSRDKALIDADIPHVPKYVIPNGVDTSYFKPSTGSPEAHTLVFTGAMNYFPNADAMIYFLKEIFPLVRNQIPDVRLYVVGGGPPRQLTALASENVIVTGRVEDVRPYVHRASVYVVPLRMGGGTRLKVLEAMAMEKPVVTTQVGCEGIRVKDRHSVLVADDPGRFAASVVEAMQDPDLRRRLVTNGRQVVEAEYKWSVIGDRLNEVYAMIMAQNRASARAPHIHATTALTSS